MRRAIIQAGIAAALLSQGAMMAAAVQASIEPAPEPEPGSARNRPSGSKPVSGGGARERERRLRQLSKQKPE